MKEKLRIKISHRSAKEPSKPSSAGDSPNLPNGDAFAGAGSTTLVDASGLNPDDRLEASLTQSTQIVETPPVVDSLPREQADEEVTSANQLVNDSDILQEVEDEFVAGYMESSELSDASEVQVHEEKFIDARPIVADADEPRADLVVNDPDSVGHVLTSKTPASSDIAGEEAVDSNAGSEKFAAVLDSAFIANESFEDGEGLLDADNDSLKQKPEDSTKLGVTPPGSSVLSAKVSESVTQKIDLDIGNVGLPDASNFEQPEPGKSNFPSGLTVVKNGFSNSYSSSIFVTEGNASDVRQPESPVNNFPSGVTVVKNGYSNSYSSSSFGTEESSVEPQADSQTSASPLKGVFVQDESRNAEAKESRIDLSLHEAEEPEIHSPQIASTSARTGKDDAPALALVSESSQEARDSPQRDALDPVGPSPDAGPISSVVRGKLPVRSTQITPPPGFDLTDVATRDKQRESCLDIVKSDSDGSEQIHHDISKQDDNKASRRPSKHASADKDPSNHDTHRPEVLMDAFKSLEHVSEYCRTLEQQLQTKTAEANLSKRFLQREAEYISTKQVVHETLEENAALRDTVAYATQSATS